MLKNMTGRSFMLNNIPDERKEEVVANIQRKLNSWQLQRWLNNTCAIALL
jgi:hypothetical protein